MTPALANPPLVEREIGAAGDRLHYAEYGRGPTVAWLHGGGPGASGLSNFRGNLPAFGGYRNLVFDLPGFGRSAKPVLDEPLSSYAADRLAAALDELVAGPVHLVGNSLGGAVATKLAIERPDFVVRLVVMGGAGTIPKRSRRLPEGLALILEDLLEGPSRERTERFVRTIVHKQSLATGELIDERHRASLDPQLRAAQARNMPPIGRLLRAARVPVGRILGFGPLQPVALRAIASTIGDLKGELHLVRAPTLLVWGREDRFIPIEWGLVLLRGIPDATLHVIPDCGHWAQYEQRERFDRLVLDFLAGAAQG
jgi:4,5:9,10-diseco-3-hydroxy-5,9,17-trioxoandrosta-1(10),2-diene-4-oate hydrolase